MKRQTVVATTSFVLFVLLMTCASAGAHAQKCPAAAISILQNSQHRGSAYGDRRALTIRRLGANNLATIGQSLAQRSKLVSNMSAHASSHNIGAILAPVGGSGNAIPSLTPRKKTPPRPVGTNSGLRGPKGGIKGIGPRGPAGPAGADGAIGPAGPAGADGAIGPAGADGAVGPAGPAGADGAVGPAGADGAVGPAGADAPTSAFNLAINKAALSPSTGSTPTSAMDGNLTSAWTSPGLASPAILGVDLGAKVLLNQVRLYWTDTGAKDFTIEVSNDNSTWTTVSTIAADTNALDILTFPTVSDRYIRVHGTQNIDDIYSLAEFEVY